MRIALNLHGFRPGSGGVETYLINLLSSLQRLPSEDEFVVLCGEKGRASFPIVSPAFSMKENDFDSFGWPRLARGLLKKTVGYDLLRNVLKSVKVDAVHHPLTVLNPLGSGVPSVLTFHDLQQEYFPQFFSSRELKQRRRDYRASVREARKIIAISHHCKKGLTEFYGVSEEKVSVVYHGVSEIFRKPMTSEQLYSIAQSYGLDRPVMIYPAATWPHKNHRRLLAALKVLIDRGQFDGELLLTGGEQVGHQDVLGDIQRLGLSAHCRWLGMVDPVALVGLLHNARLMVFPSLFEGFGLPVLEAMTSGCPVVCSNSTSLPEVAGSAAGLFDPLSVEEMASVIGRAWNDATLCREMKEKGLEQAGAFSWERTARETLTVYQSVR